MSRIVCCPPATALESVVTSLTDCPSSVGQVQKLVFWRTGNSIASVTTALIQTTWDTLLAAADDTKALVTPLLHNPDVPMGDPREFGGGNETQWGATYRKGGQAPTATFTMHDVDQDAITSLKKLACEYLAVIFIDEANRFVYSDTGSTVAGFEVVPNSLFVSDKKLGGFDEPDTNLLMFDLQPMWSDTLEITIASTFALAMVNS